MLGDHGRFQRLGLKRNPFGTLTDAEQLEAIVTPPAIDQLRANGIVNWQILGDRGRGKSTTLRLLMHHLTLDGVRIAYESVPIGDRTYKTETHHLDAFALDEAQRLNILERRRLFRFARTRPLLIGSHADFSGWFAARNLSLNTVYAAKLTDRAHIETILSRRLAMFTLPGNAPMQFTPEAIDYLWQRFRDDIRSMEHHLYRVFQRIETAQSITVQALADG